MEKVVLLNAGKTKSGKTVINFGLTINNNYKKGFEVITQYIDDANLFDKLKESDFGVPYDAEVGYRDTYNGQAIKQLTSVSNRNGEIVFEV